MTEEAGQSLNENATAHDATAHDAAVPVRAPRTWSIGMYEGPTPVELLPAEGADNPVVTASDVTDVPASFVADPFMLRACGAWHMFFEVLNTATNLGEIGHARSDDGLRWSYDRIVLREPFHLSYPHAFEHEGEFYMTPETLGAGAVRLYKATEFPARWSPVCELIDVPLADPSVFRFGSRWWLFGCSTPQTHDTLRLYYSERLEGPWAEHPRSPIVNGDAHTARPAGRVVRSGARLIRFAQDCFPVYGTRVRAFEITELSARAYSERECVESPVVGPSGAGWNGLGMHHLDAHETRGRGGVSRWLACADGRRPRA